MPIDDRTSTQNYPKPNLANTLADDVGRLRTALDEIDADMAVRVTTSDTGTVSTAMLANDAVTYAKIQNVSATDKLLGRSTAGAGDVEEITCTAAGRALLDDADATAQRATLGLGTLATQSGTFSGTSSGTNTGDQTITLTGDVTGSGTGSFATAIAAGAIVDADISATAEIAVSKLADGAARQLLQTDAAGTGVEWTSDVAIPGTLSVPLGSASAPSLYFTGDTNTGLYSPGADQLALATNGTGRLFIASDGNVGIGNSSPSYLVDVTGASLGATSGDERLLFRTSSYTGNSDGLEILFKRTASSPTNWTSADLILRRSVDTTAGQGAIKLGGDNSVSLWTNSNERLRIDSSGRVGIGTSSPGVSLEVNGLIYSKISTTGDAALAAFNSIASVFLLQQSDKAQIYTGAGQPIVFTNNNVERARIDSSGRLLVGTSTTVTNGQGDARLQVSTSSYYAADFGQFTNDQYSSVVYFKKTRGTTAGSFTSVSNSDDLGEIRFAGADGSTYIPAALIKAQVDGTPGANDMPGRLVFSTTADGAASPTERMRITSAGQMRLAGAGITFNGDTAAANELDDYEEGTWTPSLPNGGTLTVSYARYTKIGNMVYANFYVSSVAPTNNASEFRIGGLPFTIAATSNYAPGGYISYCGDANLSNWSIVGGGNTTNVAFQVVSGSNAARTNAQFITAASGSIDEIVGTIMYHV